MGESSIKWVINPVQIIQIILIIAACITAYIFFTRYMDEKYHLEELKEQYKQVEIQIKEAEEKADKLSAEISGYKKRIRQWEKKYNEIKKPVNLGGVLDLLNSE